jgi:uncharacterized protein YbbK (DUF523 family)
VDSDAALRAVGRPAAAPQSAAARPAIVVSACLMGVECNHRGRGQSVPALDVLAESNRLIPVCPEVAGGLPTPRPAAELGADGRVRTADGADVTDFYARGAAHAVAVAQASGARRAVLKARSPSCGCHQIYDGTHRRELVARVGLTAAALRDAGLEVCSEEDL